MVGTVVRNAGSLGRVSIVVRRSAGTVAAVVVVRRVARSAGPGRRPVPARGPRVVRWSAVPLRIPAVVGSYFPAVPGLYGRFCGHQFQGRGVAAKVVIQLVRGQLTCGSLR